jgi:hypothetical protein
MHCKASSGARAQPRQGPLPAAARRGLAARCAAQPARADTEPTPSAPAASRRRLLAAAAAVLAAAAAPPPPPAAVAAAAAAEAEAPAAAAAAGAEGALPAAYLELARALAAALREAVEADLGGAPEREVRRRADPAKDLVKKFVGRWRGAPEVASAASYAQLTAAVQELGEYYRASGARAALTTAAGGRVLARLAAAEAALGPAPPRRTGLLPF